ncbi:hypothetical protein [Aridibaculum aurantiacum]|uniref:hypothetical protein n=1 Tax=Aridibaculum aurantiacum TaxID=2810307 RepID=UPI001A970D0D|nr:hypothetical protein [Aridibaculum aurantiacum]
MQEDFFNALVLFENWLPPLIISVVLLKLVLFVFFRTSNSRIGQFFYFNDYQVVDTKCLKNVTIKIVQNCLSFYLLFLLVFHLVLLLAIQP